jgi:hypothetical protein
MQIQWQGQQVKHQPDYGCRPKIALAGISAKKAIMQKIYCELLGRQLKIQKMLH